MDRTGGALREKGCFKCCRAFTIPSLLRVTCSTLRAHFRATIWKTLTELEQISARSVRSFMLICQTILAPPVTRLPF